jgi:hypothetical protein
MKRKQGPSKEKPTLKKQKTSGFFTPRTRLTGVGLKPELKFNDSSFNADATTTGSVVALNQMAAGDTALLRDGNRIKMKSIQLKFTLELEAITQNAVCRFLIVYDRNTNLTNPTIATAGTGPLDTITVQSLRQVATVSRFKVLYDKSFALNSTSDTATALQIQFEEVFVKIPLDCQDTAFADGAAGAPISGGLYLMFFSNIAAGATDVNVAGQARLRFWG